MRLINADELMELYDGCDGLSVPIAVVQQNIKDATTIDVAPVRHGRWVTHSDRSDSLICSVCNCGFDMWKHDPHNYCPNCGADMDGDYNG